jgi:hypothetical protein
MRVVAEISLKNQILKDIAACRAMLQKNSRELSLGL